MDLYSFRGFFDDGDAVQYILGQDLNNAISNLQQQFAFLYNTNIDEIVTIDTGRFLIWLKNGRTVYTYDVIWYKRQ